MFEEEFLAGSTEKSIRVDTHLGTAIPNVIAPQVDEVAKRKYSALRERYGANWINRKPATGVYNCFGMIFASRRTSIYDDENVAMIQRILDDDGYRCLSNRADVRTGDLVLYRDARSKQALHVAQVTRRQPLILTNELDVADGGGACYALSKWNDRSGEDEHHIEHHCWKDFDNLDVLIEFWTDRPKL